MYGNNGQGNERSLALPDLQTALESSEEANSMRNQAAIWRAVLPNGEKLSDLELLAGVAYGKSQGLDPVRGDFYIVPGMGVVPGYRGEIKRQSGMKRSEPIVQPRQATAAEVDQNDIQPGDFLAVCDLIDPDAARQCRELGIKYVPITGYGIVRKAETWESYEWKTSQNGKRYKSQLPENQWTKRVNPPTGRSWWWVARNRAEKDARRHWGGAVDADEVLAEYGEVERVPEGVVLTAEQARAWGETHSVAAIEARKTVTPELMTAFERRQQEAAADLDAFDVIDVEPMQTPEPERPMPGLIPAPVAAEKYSGPLVTMVVPDDATSQSQADFREMIEPVQNPVQAKAASATNGKGAPSARIGSDIVKTWPMMCQELVGQTFYYRNALGQPDMFRILRAAKAEGFDEVNAANADAVYQAVKARGLRHEQEEREKQAKKEAAHA